MMVDHMVGEVLQALEDAGMTEDTLVIFSSDNGPVWYEEDANRLGHDSSGGLRGMKADAWEAGHRVPFLIRWPGHVAAGSTTHQLISFTDVLPTLASVVEQPLPEAAAPDGRSFHSVLVGESAETRSLRQTLALASGNGKMTFRDGPWKLIQGLGSGGFSKPANLPARQGDPAGQLYHLGRDPGELVNLYAFEPQKVAEMEAMLAAELTNP